ncbi:MAG: outer membrane beta-barrel protein, partial [Muribaculaceae bacterium]|nr:outer membrane beta-barrel protein [Muribaculaceae bacterium]
VKMGSTWQINLGASKSFGFHWEVSLALNDILNTARKNRFTTYSGAMKTYMERIINTRSVELSISYKFNYDKSKYSGKGAGNEEKMRF